VSLVSRGYALVHINSHLRSVYDDFCHSFEEFCASDLKEKSKYGNLQFERNLHSPNQVLFFLFSSLLPRLSNPSYSFISFTALVL
jgi:hypothetical protein